MREIFRISNKNTHYKINTSLAGLARQGLLGVQREEECWANIQEEVENHALAGQCLAESQALCGKEESVSPTSVIFFLYLNYQKYGGKE